MWRWLWTHTSHASTAAAAAQGCVAGLDCSTGRCSAHCMCGPAMWRRNSPLTLPCFIDSLGVIWLPVNAWLSALSFQLQAGVGMTLLALSSWVSPSFSRVSTKMDGVCTAEQKQRHLWIITASACEWKMPGHDPQCNSRTKQRLKVGFHK